MKIKKNNKSNINDNIKIEINNKNMENKNKIKDNKNGKKEEK